MSKTRTVRTSTTLSGKLTSDQHQGLHSWQVEYLDPASGEILELNISCNSGKSPKEVLESMGVPFDFGCEVRFV